MDRQKVTQMETRKRMQHASIKLGSAGQRGLSMYGWLFVLIVGASVLTAGLRLGPHYIDFNIILGVADRLPADTVHTMSREEIREHFKKQLRIENFRTPINDIMKIEREGGKTVLNINYERREHMLYNVDVVLTFSEQRTYQ